MLSDQEKRLIEIRNKFLGIEEQASIKSYYPQLKEKIDELEKSESFLRDKSKALLNILEDLEHEKIKTQQSEEKYRRFFEEDLSGIFLSTPEGKMKACNPAYVKMMEYESEEDILVTNTTTHYEQPQSRIEFLNLLREKRKLINYEGSVVTKSGKVIQTLENIIGVFDKDDNLIEFWGYVNDITDRKKAEAVLKKSAEEKEALHRELLHRVKNSFNLVKSLIFLEREKLNESKASLVLEKIEMRVNALGKMYSLLNLSGTSQQIDLGAYLNEITISLVNSYIQDSKRIDVKTNFDSIITSPKTASSVGLILNELLTNSLKYAFPENRSGIIHVGLRTVNGNAEIKIADNGIGVPEDFKIEDSSGMGLQLVNMLILQLSGTIEVDKKLGTSFRIVFPLNE